jgi:SAM-dependent methyltransferase
MKHYEDELVRQFSNVQTPTCKTYYSWLYSLITNELDKPSSYLEIGAGAGISRLFLGEFDVLRTDFLPWQEGNVIGAIDAQNLPYEEDSFDGVIGVDMIHHVEKPALLLNETIRVTKPGGVLVFIEPYVSIISYPVYKIFHPERVTVPNGFDPNKTWVSDSASDGDQSVSQRIFCTKSGKEFLVSKFEKKVSIEVDYLSPIAFYLTRGLNNPSTLPAWLIKAFVKVDSLIPRFIRKFTASRMIVVMRMSI